MDSARPFGCPDPLLEELLSRLNAVAVLAFCAEITRLPGHWAAAFTPENATAQTIALAVHEGGPHVVVEAAGFGCHGRDEGRPQLPMTREPTAARAATAAVCRRVAR